MLKVNDSCVVNQDDAEATIYTIRSASDGIAHLVYTGERSGRTISGGFFPVSALYAPTTKQLMAKRNDQLQNAPT